MKTKQIFLSTLFTACCFNSANAAIPPFSQYGQIQNVQSYSSNPFYNPDSPYNQRLPTPIYAQGTELTAGECRSVVDSIIAGYCASKNNCDGLSYSDISPAVIIQLSNMTGHNYVTSCGGYVPTAVEDYKKNTNSMTITGFPSAFPTVDVQTEKPSGELVLNNPFEIKDPQWQKERDARQKELRDLQKKNGSDDVELEATKFPTTYADLSFTERMANDKAGYEPWKDASGYKPIKVEEDKKRYDRELEIAEKQKLLADKKNELLENTDQCAWCKQQPKECYEKLSKNLSDLNKAETLWEIAPSEKCGWEIQKIVIPETPQTPKEESKKEEPKKEEKYWYILLYNDKEPSIGCHHNGSWNNPYDKDDDGCLNQITTWFATTYPQTQIELPYGNGKKATPGKYMFCEQWDWLSKNPTLCWKSNDGRETALKLTGNTIVGMLNDPSIRIKCNGVYVGTVSVKDGTNNNCTSEGKITGKGFVINQVLEISKSKTYTPE